MRAGATTAQSPQHYRKQMMLCSAGEHWDFSEQMDTYYNPIPHFTYKMALDHSPTLKNVPTLPRGGLDGLDDGIDAL